MSSTPAYDCAVTAGHYLGVKKTVSLNKWNGHMASPLPSPGPIAASWLSGDLVTDGADKMCLSAVLKPTGRKTCWWGYYRFHTPRRLLSIKYECLSPHFFPDVLSAPSFLSVDWPFLPLPPSPSLFNNNPLSYFILLIMVSSSIMAFCSFSDLSDGSLSSPTLFLSFLPSVLSVCLVSQC